MDGVASTRRKRIHPTIYHKAVNRLIDELNYAKIEPTGIPYHFCQLPPWNILGMMDLMPWATGSKRTFCWKNCGGDCGSGAAMKGTRTTSFPMPLSIWIRRIRRFVPVLPMRETSWRWRFPITERESKKKDLPALERFSEQMPPQKYGTGGLTGLPS